MLGSLTLAKEYRTEHNGVTHVVFRQRFGGLDVAYSDFVVNIDAQGRVINAGGNLFAAPAAGANPPAERGLAASVRAAMEWADKSKSPGAVNEVQGTGKMRRFARADGQGEVLGRAVWYPAGGQLQPAWQFYLNDSSGARQALVVHGETQTVLETQPLTFFQSPPAPRGLVFTGSSPQPNPRPGFVMTEPPPVVPRVLVSFGGDGQASPLGWVHGTRTEGNNVAAGRNPLGEFFLAEPVTAEGPGGDFQFPLDLAAGKPAAYVDAAVTNLFYWMNRSHDLFWHIGFDEAAGNYQKENFGRGGIGGDPIHGYAQFGSQQTFGASFNNAFYTTMSPEDGSPAMIAMFLGIGSNSTFTDGSYDAEVIVHEYTHGVSLRLVRNLTGHHGGAMGEAWSDFFALEFTTPEGAPPGGVYSVGDYFLQRLSVGFRTRPYSTDMDVNPVTFADFGRVTFLPAIHNDGGIWVQALFEMRANLIAQFGETEGRRRTRLLVIDGMKLSVPAPSMVDARDAILLADRVNFNGQSQEAIWRAFAKRGLGVTAYSPSNNSTHVTASFDRPSSTGILKFSEPSYVFGESPRVLLYDADLTQDVVEVQLTSYEVGGDVQTIQLRRTGSVYTGVVPTSNFAAAEIEDGGLAVMPGSIISAYYNDARTADGTPRQISVSVPMRPNYARSLLAPSFQFANERALNLRSTPGAVIVQDLPFEFPFYGKKYSSVRVLSNGLLAFDLPPGSGCWDTALLRQVTGIAPYFGPIRTNGAAQANENVYVSQRGEDSITFRWAGETNVQGGLGLSPEPVNFAATLYRDGRVEFNYGSGNRNLSFPSSTASSCSAASIGLSNGNGTAVSLMPEYIGRSSLENVPSVMFEPPEGMSSVPEIRIEVPTAADRYQGFLLGQAVISDSGHPVTDVYVLVDDILRGRASFAGSRPDVCAAQRLSNCGGYAFNFNFGDFGLAPGPHKLRLRAMNSRGGLRDSEVTFQVGDGQASAPVVAIEAPAEGGEVSGTVTLRGYAAAPNLRIAGIDVLIDGVTYGRAIYGQVRTDVCARPGFTSPNCPGVGWTFTINSVSGSIPLPDGEHGLQLRVQDETGRFTVYPETPLKFNVSNGPNLAPLGVLATPVNGQRVSGTILVWGYAWDPDGRVIAAQLLVDGVARATLPYFDPRPGECPGIGNPAPCPNIGFWHEFNTKTLLNGPHVLGIRLVDDRGRVAIIPQNAAGGMTIIVDN